MPFRFFSLLSPTKSHRANLMLVLLSGSGWPLSQGTFLSTMVWAPNGVCVVSATELHRQLNDGRLIKFVPRRLFAPFVFSFCFQKNRGNPLSVWGGSHMYTVCVRGPPWLKADKTIVFAAGWLLSWHTQTQLQLGPSDRHKMPRWCRKPWSFAQTGTGEAAYTLKRNDRTHAYRNALITHTYKSGVPADCHTHKGTLMLILHLLAINNAPIAGGEEEMRFWFCYHVCGRGARESCKRQRD